EWSSCTQALEGAIQLPHPLVNAERPGFLVRPAEGNLSRWWSGCRRCGRRVCTAVVRSRRKSKGPRRPPECAGGGAACGSPANRRVAELASHAGFAEGRAAWLAGAKSLLGGSWLAARAPSAARARCRVAVRCYGLETVVSSCGSWSFGTTSMTRLMKSGQ